MREITITWNDEDIQHACHDAGVHFEPDQIRDVLTILQREHDREHGITWEIVAQAIERVKESLNPTP